MGESSGEAPLTTWCAARVSDGGGERALRTPQLCFGLLTFASRQECLASLEVRKGVWASDGATGLHTVVEVEERRGGVCVWGGGVQERSGPRGRGGGEDNRALRAAMKGEVEEPELRRHMREKTRRRRCWSRRGQGSEKRPPVTCCPEGELQGDRRSPLGLGDTDISVGPGKRVFRTVGEAGVPWGTGYVAGEEGAHSCRDLRSFARRGARGSQSGQPEGHEKVFSFQWAM